MPKIKNSKNRLLYIKKYSPFLRNTPGNLDIYKSVAETQTPYENYILAILAYLSKWLKWSRHKSDMQGDYRGF